MEKIIIPNPEQLQKKKQTIKKQKHNSLHILSDFDRTFNYAYVNNEKVSSLISLLRNGKYLTPDYSEKAHELFNKYHPIEISSKIPINEKIIKMNEWWETHFKLLVDSGLDKKTIKQFIKQGINSGKMKLRKGIPKFLDILNEKSIPIIIMSASVGDFIKEFLNQEKIKIKNIHIVGNIFEYNSEGKFKGIKNNNIIHVFNKKESTIESLEIYPELQKRRNIILIGDSLGDSEMAEEFPYKEIIKIGFLNPGEEDNIEKYKQNFDMILTGDSDFSPVIKLIKELTN
jgi:5'-nucleotidase